MPNKFQIPDTVKKDFESAIDQFLLDYSKTPNKRKIGKIPRIFARFMAAIPLETIIQILQTKMKK